MSIAILEEFAQLRTSGFRCEAAGSPVRSPFLVSVEHHLFSPTDPSNRILIQELLGAHSAQALAFYERHDGGVLYLQRDEAAGIAVLPVADWKEATEDMRRMCEFLSEDPAADPDHILSGIAFGAVPGSGNYFVMPIEGPTAGKIFYADHDGWYESAFSDDFNGFLAEVTRNPAQLLSEKLGCYTRYSDGMTDTQWIPTEFFEDISKARP